MLLYDFKCSLCDHEHEEFADMDEKSLLLCPSCDKLSSVRVPSSSTLFKGLPFGNGKTHENVQK